MFGRKKQKDETAATAAAIIAQNAELKEQKDDKAASKGLFKRVSGLMVTMQDVGDNVNEFYTNWIKPVYDNRAQIARRLNALSTLISVLFFLIYVPFLTFSRIAKGLSLGMEVALYVCIGLYAVTLIALIFVSVFSGRSTTTEMAKRRRRVTKIVMYIVRVASVAIAITALAITSSARADDTINSALHTVGIVFSVVSIIFSALPLIFGGMGGVFKWLISPAKVKYAFSFVALEWYSLLTSDKRTGKVKRINTKYYEAVAHALDDIIIPALGDIYIKSVTADNVLAAIDAAPEESRELTKAVIQNIFIYATDCGYVQTDPCEGMGLTDDISMALESDIKKNKAPGFFARLFGRHGKSESESDGAESADIDADAEQSR